MCYVIRNNRFFKLMFQERSTAWRSKDSARDDRYRDAPRDRDGFRDRDGPRRDERDRDGPRRDDRDRYPPRRDEREPLRRDDR